MNFHKHSANSVKANEFQMETETCCSIRPFLPGRPPDLNGLPAQLRKDKGVQTSPLLAGSYLDRPPGRWGLHSAPVLRISYAAVFDPFYNWGRFSTKTYAGFIFRAASYYFRLWLFFLESPSYRILQEFCLPFTSVLLPLLRKSKSVTKRPISSSWDTENNGGKELKKSFFMAYDLLQRELYTLLFSFVRLYWFIGSVPGESPDNATHKAGEFKSTNGRTNRVRIWNWKGSGGRGALSLVVFSSGFLQ